MCVITITRGAFLGGERVAQRAADELGFRCVNRDTIIDKVAAAGVSHDALREALTRPPSLLDRWITHRRHVYLALLQAALAEEVQEGSVVYHGYGGHLLLEGAGPVFRVCLTAGMEFRLNLAQRELELDRERARAHLEKVDLEHARWTRALYGVNWDDPSQYDLVLNLGRLFGIEEAVRVVVSAVRGLDCLAFNAARKAAMRDFALASRVNAALALNPHTEALPLEVTSLNGVVTIGGTLESDEQLKDVERIAAAVPGVRSVRLRY